MACKHKNPASPLCVDGVGAEVVEVALGARAKVVGVTCVVDGSGLGLAGARRDVAVGRGQRIEAKVPSGPIAAGTGYAAGKLLVAREVKFVSVLLS